VYASRSLPGRFTEARFHFVPLLKATVSAAYLASRNARFPIELQLNKKKGIENIASQEFGGRCERHNLAVTPLRCSCEKKEVCPPD
jgi:hypothetical protein